jgi:hypothetical protein
MKRVTGLVLLSLVSAWPVAGAAQVAQSGRLSSLEGRWVRDAQRTMPDACGTFIGPPPGEARTITFPKDAVRITTDAYGGEFPLSGAAGTTFDGRPGTVSLEAGWLAVTMIRQRSDGGTHVLREVYIVRGDDLTVWRTLTVNLPDGTQGKIDCGNHAAIVYRRSSAAPVRE